MRAAAIAPIAFAIAVSAAASSCAPAPDEADPADTGMAADPATADAETTAAANPRFGRWRLESDSPPPASNVMTYEPYGDGGMKITVASVNAEGEANEWSYVTMFDGEFRPVEGQENAETAVEVIDERTNRILNARDGEVYQVIINVLSEDGNTIDNEYRRTMPDGAERVSHAGYRRIE